jgi:siderophore synthetase component
MGIYSTLPEFEIFFVIYQVVFINFREMVSHFRDSEVLLD